MSAINGGSAAIAVDLADPEGCRAMVSEFVSSGCLRHWRRGALECCAWRRRLEPIWLRMRVTLKLRTNLPHTPTSPDLQTPPNLEALHGTTV